MVEETHPWSSNFQYGCTAWKLSKYGPEITLYLDNFHAVVGIRISASTEENLLKSFEWSLWEVAVYFYSVFLADSSMLKIIIKNLWLIDIFKGKKEDIKLSIVFF